MSDERSLRFTRTAEKELRRLDPPIRARVMAALDRLGADDRSLDVRRLTGNDHFRLRVGDWRVIFDYDHAHRRYSSGTSSRGAEHTSDRAPAGWRPPTPAGRGTDPGTGVHAALARLMAGAIASKRES